MDHKNKSLKKPNLAKQLADPFATREAEKYSNPIPSREYIINLLQEIKEPLTFKKLQQQLEISGEQQEIALKRRLKAMIRDGQLKRKSKSYYLKQSFNPDNYNKTLGHESNSKVFKKIVGNFLDINGFNYVMPFLHRELYQDILIPAGSENNAKPGDWVVVDVIMPVFKWADPIGKVINVLGKSKYKDNLINAAVINLEIPNSWSAEDKQEISKISKEISEEVIAARVDLRHLDFITIDGEDAKDFDDAVFGERLPRNGWKLYVAIADVSYYVQPGSAIDLAARTRGNSVYFPGKVIPMLPELLANQLCSLKPNTDRLAMVCEMQINSSGKLVKYKFYEAVIRSKARLTYSQVGNFLNTQQIHKLFNKNVVANLTALNNIYSLLKKQRELRGAIDFQSSEGKLIFNDQGQAIEIKNFTPNVAHKLIEECMLAANVATAKLLQKHKLLSIYRVHEGPRSVKLLDLKNFLAGLGLSLDSADSIPSAKDYAKLLQDITTRADADVIQMILLRSMCQAMYSIDNIGHFGLAYPAYTHFTSPIRRYTDLIVHRHIKSIINEDKTCLQVGSTDLAAIANHCSMTERRADEATREVLKACKCQYLTKFIGEKFDGIVSGVTKFGLFVEIKDIYIDGLLHVNSLLEDYFIHDPVHHRLIGEKTGKIYNLGKELKVVLAKVDVNKRRIDFVLADESGGKHLKKKLNNHTVPAAIIKDPNKVKENLSIKKQKTKKSEKNKFSKNQSKHKQKIRTKSKPNANK